MYEIGTRVRYHGSMAAYHGEIFVIGRLCCDGARYVIVGSETLRHVRHMSIAPVTEVDPIDQLEAAIEAQRPVMITYVAGDGAWTTRVIEPHSITYSDAGHASVRAYDRLRSAIRAFRGDRIQDLTVLPDAFRSDPSDDGRERAALARIRAEIDLIPDHNYVDAAHWTPTP